MGKRENRFGGMGGFGPVIVQDLGEGGWEEQQALFEYLCAHDLLPTPCGPLPDGEVLRLSSVLSNPVASREDQKKALILLAHSRNPRASTEIARHFATVEASLGRFAAFALDESVQWTQGPGAVSTSLA